MPKQRFRCGCGSFDNILRVWSTLFQCITLEGWIDIAYVVSDAGAGWTAGIFFISFVCFGSFYMLNLFLAVMVRNGSRTSRMGSPNAAPPLPSASQPVSTLSSVAGLYVLRGEAPKCWR